MASNLSRCDFGYAKNCLFLNNARKCVALSSTTFTEGKCPFYKNRENMTESEIKSYKSGEWKRKEKE